MARRDDDDYEDRVAREVARLRSGQEQVAKLEEAEARYKRQQEDAAQQAAANAAIALNRAPSRQAQRPVVRTKYTGPDPDRASRGNFVSKEELADFQRKNPGATLRDLLNADRGLTRRGAPPPATEAMRGMGMNRAAAPSSATDARARGIRSQGANLLERTEENYPAVLDLQLGDRRVSPADAARSAKIIAEEPQYRKGGKVKAYAKGGSVKGSGCEQRGLRKCKVY